MSKTRKVKKLGVERREHFTYEYEYPALNFGSYERFNEVFHGHEKKCWWFYYCQKMEELGFYAFVSFPKATTASRYVAISPKITPDSKAYTLRFSDHPRKNKHDLLHRDIKVSQVDTPFLVEKAIASTVAYFEKLERKTK